MTQPQHLDVTTLPLSGRHLIEASAGTGKTFNITRLYLRLLLEKQLTVQEILVMTFTKAATEEIRGRLAETLDAAMTFWQMMEAGEATLQNADPVLRHLYEATEPEQALMLLQAAQLEMDEAAVFTIHGFCQHVLSLLSFESQTPMQLSLITDTTSLYLEAAEDWIRHVATEQAEGYMELTRYGWHRPENLLDEFGSAIKRDVAPRLITQEIAREQAQAQRSSEAATLVSAFAEVREHLLQHEAYILDTLVHAHKEEERRREEWAVLLQWLSVPEIAAPPKQVSQFISGSRYPKNETMAACFQPVKALKDEVKKRADDIDKVEAKAVEDYPAFALIAHAFDFIRERVRSSKARDNLIEFDDLIQLLANATADPDSPLTASLRHRFPAALIDEFQDTDAHQYAIADAVYPRGASDHVLLMIGDPKQAIYGFRGGDIFTYLRAGREADYKWYMDTNWRSVDDMVSAYNRLFYGAPLDEPADGVFGFDIPYLPVKSTPQAKAAEAPLYDPDPARAALTYVSVTADDEAKKPHKQLGLSRWIGEEIHRLLSEATLGERPLRPSDIAILVRSSSEATLVKTALAETGLGTVFLSNKQSLFSSPQCRDLYRVLDGIWHLNVQAKLSACLSSPLLGFSHQQVINLLHHDDDQLWDALLELLGMLRQMWQQRGCMSVILYLLQYRYQPVVSSPEREITNYLHLSEVVEREAMQHARADQLLLWLHRQSMHPQQNEELIQRLESDDRLIQIVTQHGAKGLEYPIVFIPFANDYRDPAKQGNQVARQFQYFDEHEQKLVYQLGQTHSAISRVQAEGDAEAMRLLYVAVTRAAHRCYLGVAPFEKQERSALAVAMNVHDQNHDTLLGAIDNVVTASSGHTSLLHVSNGETTIAGRISPANRVELTVAEFSGSVEERWRLLSFSSLARQQHQSRQTLRDREFQPQQQTEGQPDVPAVFRFQFEKGARAGNLLHDMLEHHDFTQPDFDENSQVLMQRFGLESQQRESLVNWLNETLLAPLNEDRTLSLSALPVTSTLREAEFYFPMQGLSFSRLRDILTTHRATLSSLCEPQPVAFPGRSELEGMMHGFIDLIFEHDGRYYVCDYKSTWLGNDVDDYLPSALCLNNQHHLYDLQYLIYSLALHRYLKLSVPDYDPQQHFGGIYYLYLRGMHPENQEQQGVFYTALSPALIASLDTLFDPANSKVNA